MNWKMCRITVLCLFLLLTRCTPGNGSDPETPEQGGRKMHPNRSPQGIQQEGDASGGQGLRGGHPSPIAGSWYPRDPEKLRRLLEETLAQAPPPDPAEAGRLIAVIAPHAGYAYSAATAAHAYKWVQQRKPKRILILGPSHYDNFRGISFGDYAYFETPLGKVPVDRSRREILQGCNLVSFDPGPHQQEHSLDIQLPFLQVLFRESPPSILPLLVGRLEQEDYPVLASVLAKVLDHETIVVVSSDFTHYGPRFGYVPFPNDRQVAEKLRSLDQGACEKILGLDRNSFLSYCEAGGVTICGRQPIALLLELLPRDTESRQLAYTTSGQGTGDYTNSVSYCSLAFTRNALWEREAGADGPGPERQTTMKKGKRPSQAPAMDTDRGSLTPSEKSTLLRLARDTLEEYLQKHGKPDPLSGRYEITPTLRELRGAFVTLKESGALRGCIGYIQPMEPLYATVQENAVNAATRDSRFSPVRPSELESIRIEISALTPPEPVSSYRDIVLGKHGIILKKGGYQAVFLPQVAPEQGWDLAETLRHLSRKAGLPEDAWMDPKTEFRVFTAEVFQEE